MSKKQLPDPYFSIVLVVILLQNFFLTQSAFSQKEIGFIMPEGVNKVEIEFEKYSNLIVIPVVLNKSLTLKFILDTGAESVIITEKLFADMLGLDFVREINIHGPGIVDSVTAFVASNVSISLPGNIHGDGFNVLVLEKDYLELNKNLGEEVYGILGYDLFNRFVVDIDYDDNTLTIYRPDAFKPKRGMSEMPIVIQNTKPYLYSTFYQGDQFDTVRLMVDTGASHAALLDLNATEHLILPDKLIATRLGRGLAGEIPGFIGRIDKCHLNGFELENVLISVPEQGAYIKAIKRGSRHGTLGGDILSRFRVVFDFPNERMFLSKGKYFSQDFEYNMSGMTLITEGKNLDSMVVLEVIRNTPAFLADIQKGDVILKINGYSLTNSSISEINSLLRKKDGMKIKLTLERDGERIKKQFKLRRLI